MKILSFDIGIKNLSFCLLNNDKHIEDWGIINISCDPNCQHINTKNNKCDSSASIIHFNDDNTEMLLCNSHSKLKQYPNKTKKLKTNNSIYNVGNKLIEELSETQCAGPIGLGDKNCGICSNYNNNDYNIISKIESDEDFFTSQFANFKKKIQRIIKIFPNCEFIVVL